MDISFNEVQRIAETLPIGYYAKKRVRVKCDRESPTSYYNPVDEEICVAYNNITKGLENLNNEADKEKTIRNFLYHEVSHSILTPKLLILPYDNDKDKNIINIFEDERIETVLKDFYLDVDFKENVKNVCSEGLKNVPTNPMEAFFQTVRLRKGHPTHLKQVDKIIEDFRYLSQRLTSDSMDNMRITNDMIWTYRRRISSLYNSIAKHFKEHKEEYDTQNFESEVESNGVNYGEKTIEEINKMLEGEYEKLLNGRDGGLNSIPFELSLNRLVDTKLTEQLENYIRSFNKKNSNGGCLNGYSGVLNPRSCNREDFRFFERSASTRGSNKFGTFHLNLFIDCSGSFSPNVDRVNTILKSLLDIEKRNPNFSFDLVKCEVGEELAKKNERQIYVGGGNRLDGECLELYRQLQKSNTYNFNIALFDGDAYPIESGFSAFNFNNCVIIAEEDNRRYIERQCPKAKVYYTETNYTEELTDKILKAFSIAFR